MLIFVRVLGARVSAKKVPIEVAPNAKVIDVRYAVERKFAVKRLVISRILFAGKVLQDMHRLAAYDVRKEVLLQMVGKFAALDDDKYAPPPPVHDDSAASSSNKEAKHHVDAKGATTTQSSPSVNKPALKRQTTALTLRFGDIVIVRLEEAKELV
jgi:hypothetical protein